MSESSTPKSLKAPITRTSLVLAAAALLREEGPKAVTYRKVAKWAAAASSSVGYYFDSVTELLHEAGMYNIQLWAQRAERVADLCEKLEPEECRARITELLTRACLPDDSIVPKAHYAQLIGAADSSVVTEAYRNCLLYTSRRQGRCGCFGHHHHRRAPGPGRLHRRRVRREPEHHLSLIHI